MLSLGRTPGQYIVIDGSIVIQVVSVDGSLRLAIDAPKEISIERGNITNRSIRFRHVSAINMGRKRNGR